MNIDAVIKRLEALEGKITGTKHIESIIVGALGNDGNPAPCPCPDDYTGKYVVLENVFFKVNRIWEYKPERKIIDDFREYCPPADYQNPVIYLVRNGEIEIGEAARQTIEAALKAVQDAGKDDNNQ